MWTEHAWIVKTELVGEEEVLFVRGQTGVLGWAGERGRGIGEEAGEAKFPFALVGFVHFDGFDRCAMLKAL